VEEWALRGYSHPANQDRLDKIYTVKPKAIVVIGALDQVKDVRTKWETFELFRKSIHGVEIITFDELYERARFIVDRQT
jgi:antiviral defense system Shedu protein SduA